MTFHEISAPLLSGFQDFTQIETTGTVKPLGPSPTPTADRPRHSDFRSVSNPHLDPDRIDPTCPNKQDTQPTTHGSALSPDLLLDRPTDRPTDQPTDRPADRPCTDRDRDRTDRPTDRPAER